jgi:hypothetical protein
MGRNGKPRMTALQQWARSEAFGPDFNGSPCMFLPLKPSKSDGYVYLHGKPRPIPAHRYIFEGLRGPIPDGEVLDHQCHNADPDCAGGRVCWHHACVNPWHLEAVTQRQNSLSGKGFAAKFARQTHCKRNHEFDYMYVDKRGRTQRHCMACRRDALRRFRERRSS